MLTIVEVVFSRIEEMLWKVSIWRGRFQDVGIQTVLDKVMWDSGTWFYLKGEHQAVRIV